jgi:hypothetical protein
VTAPSLTRDSKAASVFLGVGVLVEPGKLKVRRGEFFGDDLVAKVLHPLLGRLEPLVLRLLTPTLPFPEGLPIALARWGSPLRGRVRKEAPGIV